MITSEVPTQPHTRTAEGKFAPGFSGNPGGLTKEVWEARRLAMDGCPRAMQRLREWVESDNPKASIAACVAVLDRGGVGELTEKAMKTLVDQSDESEQIDYGSLSADQLSRMLAIARENLP